MWKAKGTRNTSRTNSLTKNRHCHLHGHPSDRTAASRTGYQNGDVKIIKNAGGTITHPFGSAMRSLLVAIYELGVEEVMIIGHTDCGVQHMDSQVMLRHMRERGISQDHIEMMQYCDIDLNSWLSGFNDTEEAVQKSVHIVRHHPLVPQDIRVRGFIMDSTTGNLTEVQED